MKSAFIRIFRETPLIKILDVLIENEMFDLSKTEIADLSGVSRVTLNEIFPILIREGIVKRTRKIGRATLYKLNPESLIAKKLVEMDYALIRQTVPRKKIYA